MRDRRQELMAKKSGGGESGGAGHDPVMMKIASAERYNRNHPDLVLQFTQATGIGNGEKVSAREVMEWQRKHGLTADGKVGSATIQAAESDVAFSEEEAGDVTGGVVETPHDSIESTAESGATPADDVAAEGASHSPHMPESEEEPDEKMAGKMVGKGIKQAAKGADMVEEMPNGPIGVKVGAGMLMLPYIIHLLKEKKYDKAVSTVVGMVGIADRVKIMTKALKAAGMFTPMMEKVMTHAMTAGMLADVLLLGWEWVNGSFKALAKAKAEGEAESLIGIYAYAWSSTIMTGRHSNPGAITAPQVKAKEDGIADGLATISSQPELRFLMLAEYGSEDNARKALQDSLYQREGIDVRNHEGL